MTHVAVHESQLALKGPSTTPANVCSLGTTRRVADVPLPPSLTRLGHQRLNLVLRTRLD
jgi:hypothetical protein